VIVVEYQESQLELRSFYVLFQNERSFQKQPTVFLNNKRSMISAKGKKNARYTRNVGLGFKTPREVVM
jgi:hypothetical protein